jgi:hypothetical protein
MSTLEKPKKPASKKRDNSYLDWHYKSPSPEELEDQYECFTEEEWAFHYQASREASTLPSRKKNIPAVMNREAKLDACNDCQLFYQLWARSKGLCHPIEGASTPEDRLRENANVR